LTSHVVAPVQANERIVLLDILRGFALFGILLVNFGGKVGTWVPSIDAGVLRGFELLVEDSFYPLFALLFGVGFAIQLMRATGRGSGIAHTYFRRMLALFIIGAIHTVLIWNGDILKSYALLGFILIPLHRLPARWILAAAVLLFLFQLEEGRMTAAWDARFDSPQSQQADELSFELLDEQHWAEQRAQQRADTYGSWPEKIEAGWAFFGRWLHSVRLKRSFSNDVLLLFVIGLLVGRSRFLHDFRQHRRGFTVVAVTGAVAAVAGYFGTRFYADAGGEAESLTAMASNYGMTALYLGTIALMVTRGAVPPRALAILAPVGRMALTNYLLQSIVMTLIVQTSRLNRAHVGATLLLLIGCAVFFLVQVPLSHWWLARFQYGPVEWVWRLATYGRTPAQVSGRPSTRSGRTGKLAQDPDGRP
jgi:uncharacterized protein